MSRRLAGRGEPLRRARIQVGVGQEAYFALLADGTLIRWTDARTPRRR
jgi:hypothetical protein